MTLTEQWNKGKLPEGDYYIKRRNGYLLYDNIDTQGVWRNSIDEDIEEVLAPIPSYEEWQELLKQRNQLIRDVKDLAYIQEENQQLNKRLLDMMDLLQKSYFYLNAVADKKVKTEHLEQIKTLTVLIDNVIGEKK